MRSEHIQEIKRQADNSLKRSQARRHEQSRAVSAEDVVVIVLTVLTLVSLGIGINLLLGGQFL